MAGTIGARLVLDGRAEYEQGLKQINSSLKALNSEMKLTSEQFKSSQNSAQALAKKSEILSKQYDEAGKKVALYAKRLEELQQKESSASAKVEDYKNKLAFASASLDQMKSSTAATDKAIEEQQKVVDRLQSGLKTANDELSRTIIEENKVEASLNNATAEQIRYASELDKTNSYLNEAEGNTDKLAKSINEYGQKTDVAGEQTKKLNDQLKSITDSIIYEKISEGAKELLENLMECTEVAEQFEASIAKVQSIAQVSGGELADMSEQIRQVGSDMGYGANEIAEACYQAISASVDASEAVGFVADAAKLARAGFTETTTAVDVLTTAINAYGKEANTAAHIADDLVTTQNLGKTTVDELAQSLGQIIPTASAYNVSLDQLSSSYVILTKQGINTANATTYLNGMLNELADGGSAVAKILQEETGTTFGGLMADGRTLGDIMQLLNEYVDGDSEAFANLWGNVRAGKGALAIANQGADEFNKTLSIMQNNAGATDKAFEIMADTAVMTNARFQSSIDNLKIAIGESLSPALDNLKKFGIGALEPITEFVQEHPRLVAALAGATTALTAMTAAVTGLGIAMSVLKAACGDYSGVVASLAAVVGIVGAGTALFATQTDELAESIREMTAEYDAAIEASEKLNQQATGRIESARSEMGATEELKNRIIDLNNQENLSEEQKYKLSKAVNELNAAYPDLNLEIDEQTGKLADNTEGWEKNLEAQMKREQLKYIESDLSEISKQRYENDKALYDVEGQLMELNEKWAPIQREVNELQEKGASATQQEMERLQELLETGEPLQAQYEALTESKNELTAKNEELNASYDNLIAFQQEEIGITDEAVAANEALAESGEAVVRSEEEIKEAQKAKEKAIQEANSAIGDQVGLFDEWEEKSSKLNLEKMQENWKKQTEGVQEYTEDLDYLKSVIDQNASPAITNLAETMAGLGMGSSAEIHSFVEGLKEIGDNKEALQELADTWQEHIDAISAAEDIYAGLKLQEQGYTEESSELFDSYYQTRNEAQTQSNQELVELVTQGLNDQIAAVKDATPELSSAADEMARGAVTSTETAIGYSGSRSSVFTSIGSGIAKSLADGIRSGESDVTSAMASLAGSMKDTFNESIKGLGDSLNEQLKGVREQMSNVSINTNSNVTIDADGDRLFRVVQQKNEAYIQMTGQSGLR